MRVFLVGPPGAGKSTVGRHLAAQLQASFFDLDEVIQERAGADIPWIFDVEGELGFRNRESAVVNDFATKDNVVYRLKSLFFVVAREGFLLALFGYLPAYFSGQILYSIVRNSTKLPIVMDANKTILIFILILVMCMGSAGIAMRKLVDADPAEIF